VKKVKATADHSQDEDSSKAQGEAHGSTAESTRARDDLQLSTADSTRARGELQLSTADSTRARGELQLSAAGGWSLISLSTVSTCRLMEVFSREEYLYSVEGTLLDELDDTQVFVASLLLSEFLAPGGGGFFLQMLNRSCKSLPTLSQSLFRTFPLKRISLFILCCFINFTVR